MLGTIKKMTEKNKIPTPESFFKEVPLYDVYVCSSPEGSYDLAKIIYFNSTLDSFCVECEENATFRGLERMPVKPELHPSATTMPDNTPDFETDLYNITLECTRNIHHKQYFVVWISNISYTKDDKLIKQFTFQKIGQFPSIGDLNIPGIKKYRGLLDKQYIGEFSRAIGLASHGVGIGAYVYLRRIFETLIKEAFENFKKIEKLDEEKFSKGRMNEKIIMLKRLLPSFLVDNAKIYSILSKGIHELTENECLKFFPVVKSGIELILDEKLERKNQQKKIKVASKAIKDAEFEIGKI